MVVSETVQYMTVLSLSIVFSVFAIVIQDNAYRLILKVIASLCWIVLSLTQFFFLGGSGILAVPLTAVFLGLGLVFAFLMVDDFKTQKKEKIFGFED